MFSFVHLSCQRSRCFQASAYRHMSYERAMVTSRCFVFLAGLPLAILLCQACRFGDTAAAGLAHTIGLAAGAGLAYTIGFAAGAWSQTPAPTAPPPSPTTAPTAATFCQHHLLEGQFRTVAVQSQVTYKWWWQKPEFRPLPQQSQGCFLP